MSEPLVIEATLVTPFVGDFSLPLDGILLALAMVDAYGVLDATLPGETFDYDPNEVPLQVVNAGQPDWFFACSFAEWGKYTEGQTYWNKRLDTAWAETLSDATSINTAQGAYKSYHVQLNYRHALSIRWHCVGEKWAIKRLLDGCSHIGKKTAQGWGQVAKWSVKSCEKDLSIWNEQDELVRPIPANYMLNIGRVTLDHDISFRAYRPPYWWRQNIAGCCMPIGKRS